MSALDVAGLLDGARLLVLGGTGFLGKVWLSQLLHAYPNVGHVWLVLRERKGPDGAVVKDAEARFWSEVAASPVFDPLREQHPGNAFEAFLREKVTPVAGDISEPLVGVSAPVRDGLVGRITAIVNASGVVDFNPPLDEALNVNAFGMQNLVALARELGDVPVLHTSTCYVAGDRTGQVDEVDPLSFPFPKADSLDPTLWDPDREIAEGVDLVESVRHRSNDAFRQSAFLDEARRNLAERGEPTRGTALADELAQVKRRFEKKQLVAAGTERATFWGWHNIYTYTKSIGEQVLCRSGLRFTIVRPAVIESSVAYPQPGWCEGINTSAPIVYLALQAPGGFPANPDSELDVIPVDLVASGTTIALAELLEGTHAVVYQLGASDSNPLSMYRLIELTGLYKRRHHQKSGGNPIVSWLQAHNEPTPVTADAYLRRRALPDLAKKASGLVRRWSPAPAKPLTAPAARGLDQLAKGLGLKAFVLDQFLPFMATHTYRFSCANVRRGYARLSPEDRARLPWTPEDIDWRHYMLEVHCPGLERHVFPNIEAKAARPASPLRAYDTLLDLLDEVAERHDLAPALMRTEPDGLSRTTYREMRARAHATAARLAALGVSPGDRVLLSGRNHPDWPVAWFGIVRAGAVAVPVDPALGEAAVANVARVAGVAVSIVDDHAREAFGSALPGEILDLHEATAGSDAEPPTVEVSPDDVASLLFTSGTTGDPKGVMLTHRNFASLLGSLGRLFPLRESDRVLSVLPLHHTFEFTCGLLLPLSRGARIVYLDEVNGDRLSHGLREGRVTAMVGVPALWQLLERRIRSQASERGAVASAAFDAGLALNRWLGSNTGIDVGRLFFGTVHGKLGGNVRLLISGGAALPPETHSLFAGLGLHLAEGYGLTEAAPVLAVAKGGPGARAGHVGKAVPGVELRIHEPDDNGVGEVLARGPNVMKGYYGDADATTAVLDADGWLHTGDLGRIDHKGRLVVVGRAKDVVVTASGENVYLDDVEKALGPVSGVEEYALVGLPDARGGERLALLGVHTGDPQAARAALRKAVSGLPQVQQPSVVHLVDAPLPRTATRKVQRREVRKVLERIVAASTPVSKGEGLSGPVARAVAAIAGVDVATVTPSTHLRDDLGFDSLMWVELASALQASAGGASRADALSECETVADVVSLLRLPVEPAATDDDRTERFHIPAFLREPLKQALTAAQMSVYDKGLETRVIGRAHIPHNRPTIVVSNHASHLDMGLVKYALGPYGSRIVGLAAKDYFFEGSKWWVTYFEQLTNLAPLDREGGFRASLEQARRVVERGDVVLVFPEGTRRLDGELDDFKPLVGKLALETGVDILPLYLDGTHRVLPKGAALPRGRRLEVRIGPPLEVSDLRRLSEGLRPAEAARRVAAVAREAVARLRDGDVLDLSRVERWEAGAPKEDVHAAFASLSDRLDPVRVDKPVSWYFSLGGEQGPRYTVVVDDGGVKVRPGRPQDGKADCVVKTSPDMMQRIITEAYLPGPPEFMSGAIKTNEIPLLLEFARVFNLSPELPM